VCILYEYLKSTVLYLSSLPFGLAQKQGVLDVKETFIRGFDGLLLLKTPQNLKDDFEFTALLQSILQDNKTVIQSMAVGVLETRSEMGNFLTQDRSETLDEYLNRFFMARIGVRFLLEHHIRSKNNAEGFSGIIQSNCNPMIVAQDAADESMQLCETYYGMCLFYIHMYISTDMYIMYICIYKYIYLCIHIYTYIYIDTQIYLYTYLYV
jgi:pyruvate dehydrogenase kinase 2/3/4